jgi:hypothetical protein
MSITEVFLFIIILIAFGVWSLKSIFNISHGRLNMKLTEIKNSLCLPYSFSWLSSSLKVKQDKSPILSKLVSRCSLVFFKVHRIPWSGNVFKFSIFFFDRHF